MLFVRLSVNLLRYNSLLNLLDVEQLRDIFESNKYFMEENVSVLCNVRWYYSTSISFQFNKQIYSKKIRRSESGGLSIKILLFEPYHHYPMTSF
jgi:hypothetical protein